MRSLSYAREAVSATTHNAQEVVWRLQMSRRRFCGGVSAFATQLVFGEVNEYETALPEWQSPYLQSDVSSIDLDLSGYDGVCYRNDVQSLGLKETWSRICRWMLVHGEDGFLKISSLGELYEEGLAIRDKNDKKHCGQYYTPEDVALVMSEWFDRLPGDCVCDAGCGVGNLTLAYFKSIGEKRTRQILQKGLLHLYDQDEIALGICLTSIGVRYGVKCLAAVHAHLGDFLDKRLSLPLDCKVIANPPYAAIKHIPETWQRTETVCRGMELYSSFMEKILLQSRASVIITPYSFIGGEKFFPLRRLMSEKSGFVVSFDNVPGAIFCGRKHGIFNSNTGNSVRAAITVVENQPGVVGFRFSALIRFKSVERPRLLTCAMLESFLGTRRQCVTTERPMFAKCDRRLEDIYETWLKKSDSTVAHHVSKVGRHSLSMPNTCRYFTVATDEELSRKGQVTLTFADEDVYWYVFCMINSSFAYWHWRLFDGGITYPRGLLLAMPLFFGLLSDADKKFCREMSQKMIRERDKFVIRKENVGVQENVKYPREYRDAINERFLRVLGLDADARIFDVVHSNMALEVN